MPVVPSFSGYAPAPNLAEAYLGRERIRQQAASDAARISLGYAQLQQEAVANEMELAAKKEALSRQALKTAQEQEIEKAYRETQLGLAERELQNEEAIAAMRVQEAARGFEREQAYNRVRQQKIAAGVADPQASQEAMLEVGFGQPGFAGALTPAQPRSQLPEANFRYRQIQGQIDDLMRPYSGARSLAIPANVKSSVAALRQQQSQLMPPQTVTGTNAAPKVRRYNRATGKFE